jgi:serine/threonine protein kinase
MAIADDNLSLPPRSTDLPAGLDVGGYQITHLLGEGGMGQVYAAVHPVIGKKVAIKLLAPHGVAVPDLVRRFIEEARAVNTIGHVNIIDIFSFGQLADGRQYMVMEYLNGETLADRLAGAPIDLSDLRRWLQQICAGLEAVHAAGFVHRDLKPENIWITTKAHGGTAIKLLDFGIAKLLGIGDKRITETGATVGTPGFMSPEQCLGHGVDQRADIYSFGVILYLIFTGTMPFAGSNLSEILHLHTAVPPDPPSRRRPMPGTLDKLILDCLAKDPRDRPATVAVLGQRLDAALASPGAGTIVAGSASGAPVNRTQQLPPGGRSRQRAPAAEVTRPDGHAPTSMAASLPDPPATPHAWDPPARRGRVPWLAVLGGLVMVAGGLLLARRQVPPGDLAAAAAQATARARDGLGIQARALNSKAQVAAAVHKLVVALDVGEDDVATFQDLFANEDWWQPFRTPPLISALVTEKRVLATTNPDLAVAQDAELVSWARAGREAQGVMLGQRAAYVAAAAPVTGFHRRPLDGPVVVIAAPLDQATLLGLGMPGGAVGLFDGKRVREFAGPDGPRRALATLAGPRTGRGATLLGGGLAGVTFPLGNQLTFLSVFPAPPARGSAAGLPLVLVGAAITIIGLVLGRSPRRMT